MAGPGVVQIIKFKSGLSEDEVVRAAEEREPIFGALPGLIQKFYCKDKETGEYAGIYLWESMAALLEFKESDLARTIPAAYKIKGQPRIEVLEVVSTMRPEW